VTTDIRPLETTGTRLHMEVDHFPTLFSEARSYLVCLLHYFRHVKANSGREMVVLPLRRIPLAI